MKTLTYLALICVSLFTPSLFAQTKTSAGTTNVVTAPPPISEEARKHFVMGTTLFKDAKTADDFSQVVSEFKQAADLAPQWPDARYNLALAKEAAGDYSGAMADLKLYQQFKLSDAEARTVQDKLYALEAKSRRAAQKNVSDDEAKARAAVAQAEETKYGWLQGEWSYNSVYRIRGNTNYGDASGIAKATKLSNIVEIGPINDYGRAIGDLRAIVNESGNTSWEFRFVTEYRGECGYGKRSPVNVTIGQDQRTIRFQVDTYSGAMCEYVTPFIVVLTRM